MDRIYASGAAGSPPSVPASPSSGYPTAGNPGAGTPATKPGEYWYYMITEEIRNVISDAGLTPSEASVSQLSAAIQQMISNGTQPAGTVIYFAKNTPPTGYLKANGAAVSRTTYAALFAAIGTTFGAGDGSTTFNLPDLRGEFVRGWDDSRGVDSGRAFGSFQTGTVHSFDVGASVGTVGDRSASTAVGGVAHPHLGLDYDANIATNYPNAQQSNNNSAASATVANTSEVGAGVIRPRNVSLLACIKF